MMTEPRPGLSATLAAATRRDTMRWLAAGLTAATIDMVSGAEAAADTFSYRRRVVQLMVPFSPGGIYDIVSRVVARALPAFIEGQPTVSVQNQPGAGGITSAARLASGTPADGLTIASVSRGIPQLALVGDPNISFDPARLTWLGSISSFKNDGYFLLVNASSPVRTVQDAREKHFTLGATGPGATNTTFAIIARDLLGLNVNVVPGFPGANDIWLAMDRGEVDGQLIELSAIMAARAEDWKAGKYRVLVQFARETRLPQLPDAPTGRELMTSDADLVYLKFAESPFFMAMPFAAPPNLPPDRADILRTAFYKMAQDPSVQADLLKVGQLSSPIDGAAVSKLIADAAATPKPIRDRLGKLLVPQ